MKTRIVEVSKGYVPQVWKVTDRTAGWFWWSKSVYAWYGIDSSLATLRFPDLQLMYCVVETKEEAQSVLEQYEEEQKKRGLSVVDLFLLSSN